ncbi:hypothetical protein GCM10028818_40850 [Spirosoma horti]
MKTLLVLLLSLTSFLLKAQSPTLGQTADDIFRQQPNSPGLSPRHYRNQDSVAVNITLPATVTGVKSLTTSQIFQRMKRLAKKAAVSNPLINAPYSGTATTFITSTESTTGIWASTVKSQFSNMTAQPNLAPFTFRGGVPALVGGSSVQLVAVNTGAAGTVATQVTPALEFMSDAPYFAISFYSANATIRQYYRLFINDQLYSSSGQRVPYADSLTNVNANNDLHVIGLTGVNKIRIEWGLYPVLRYIKIPTNYSTWQVDLEDNVKVGWIGDSYSSTGHSASVGHPKQFTHNNIAAITGYLLGWDVTCIAIGGTGYVNTNSGANTTYGDPNRLKMLDLQNFDAVVFWGSVNDTGSPTLQSNALAAWQGVRAKLPNAPIIIYLVPVNVNQSSGFSTTKENYLKAAFAQFNDSNSYLIPITTDSNGSWITDASATMYTDIDIVHPTTYIKSPATMPGTVYYGYRDMQAFVRQVLNQYR